MTRASSGESSQNTMRASGTQNSSCKKHESQSIINWKPVRHIDNQLVLGLSSSDKSDMIPVSL